MYCKYLRQIKNRIIIIMIFFKKYLNFFIYQLIHCTLKILESNISIMRAKIESPMFTRLKYEWHIKKKKSYTNSNFGKLNL